METTRLTHVIFKGRTYHLNNDDSKLLKDFLELLERNQTA